MIDAQHKHANIIHSTLFFFIEINSWIILFIVISISIWIWCTFNIKYLWHNCNFNNTVIHNIILYIYPPSDFGFTEWRSVKRFSTQKYDLSIIEHQMMVFFFHSFLSFFFLNLSFLQTLYTGQQRARVGLSKIENQQVLCVACLNSVNSIALVCRKCSSLEGSGAAVHSQ